MEPEFVKSVGQSYRYDARTGNVEFSDGVIYTLDETLELARKGAVGQDLKAVHEVKKAFDGELLTAPIREECSSCRGKGRLYNRAYHTYTECPKCRGIGFLTIE